MTQRYRIDISYDGTAYAGWQVQPRDMTVQQKLEETLAELTQQRTKVHGSGRTDQGVHARRQVAHFDLARPRSPRMLKRGLNALLPDDVRILRATRAPADFHARRSARSKQYRYYIWNDDIVPPFLRNYRTRVRRELDIEAMRRAASYLRGRHDFAAFAANSKQAVEDTVRHLRELQIKKHGHEVVLIAQGEGFLYKMVRSLAGWLIRVGEGREFPDDTPAVLESRRRTSRVTTARPEGLFLWDVRY